MRYEITIESNRRCRAIYNFDSPEGKIKTELSFKKDTPLPEMFKKLADAIKYHENK